MYVKDLTLPKKQSYLVETDEPDASSEMRFSWWSRTVFCKISEEYLYTKFASELNLSANQTVHIAFQTTVSNLTCGQCKDLCLCHHDNYYRKYIEQRNWVAKGGKTSVRLCFADSFCWLVHLLNFLFLLDVRKMKTALS